MLHLFPDVLTIEASGKELRAQREWKGEILIHGDQNTLLTEDVLVRKLPDGVVERYAVLDVAYQRRYGALPALTTVKVHRMGARNAPGTAAHVPTMSPGRTPA